LYGRKPYAIIWPQNVFLSVISSFINSKTVKGFLEIMSEPENSKPESNRTPSNQPTSNEVTDSQGVNPTQEAAHRQVQQRRRNQILIIGGVVVVAFVALIVLVISLSQSNNLNSIPTAINIDAHPGAANPTATTSNNVQPSATNPTTITSNARPSAPGTANPITVTTNAQPSELGAASPTAITTDTRPFELGPADAKVVIEEYGDYQCPYCKIWHDSIQSQIISTYINTGKSVKLIFRPFPFLDERYPQLNESHLMVQAAYCAREQNRFWDYHNALYSNQQNENSGFWTTDRLKSLANVLKLDTDKFNSCLDSNKYKDQANTDATNAIKRGINGTPTVIVNGKTLTTPDFGEIQKAVDAALSSATK
jgi:protein-disulfide isomerase